MKAGTASALPTTMLSPIAHSWIRFAVAASFVWASGVALAVAQTPAETVEVLRSRLDALERQLQAQRDRVDPVPVAPSGSTSSLDPALAARLEELETQIRVLARQIEIDKEQAAEKARTTPIVQAGRDGFSFRSTDGTFTLRLRGYLQSDGRFFLADDERPAPDTFTMRRVRPVVESTLYNRFDFRIMPDFAGGAASLQDAYIDARFRTDFKVRAGKYKAPFGFERLMSATEMPFIERALPTALAPNRDVGVMVHGDVFTGNLAYAVGIFNGVADGASADVDTQDGKDGVARIFAQPFRSRRDSIWRGLGAGVALSYGIQRGSLANTILPAIRTSGQQTFFSFRGQDASGPAVLANGRHARVSVQGHYFVGSFGLLAEHVLSSQELRRGDDAATVDNSAWQLAGQWVLTGETPSYRGVSPRAAFDPKNGSWGALELTARYHRLDIDRDAFPLFASLTSAARAVHGFTMGTNWILNSGVKFSANYERLHFERGADTGDRAPEQALLTRMQIGF
jgi:phosphate-selective porin OprO and OprP